MPARPLKEKRGMEGCGPGSARARSVVGRGERGDETQRREGEEEEEEEREGRGGEQTTRAQSLDQTNEQRRPAPSVGGKAGAVGVFHVT